MTTSAAMANRADAAAGAEAGTEAEASAKANAEVDAVVAGPSAEVEARRLRSEAEDAMLRRRLGLLPRFNEAVTRGLRLPSPADRAACSERRARGLSAAGAGS